MTAAAAPGEPTLDARVLAHDLDEAARGGAVVVVEPAASVDHVALLVRVRVRVRVSIH